jgi:hypothetical protein
MKAAPDWWMFVIALVALSVASTACIRSSGIASQFQEVSHSVREYCSTPAARRSAELRGEVLRKLDAFESDLAYQPPATRLKYKDRIVNQRCFVAMAH